jgi:hypothetical protein
MAPFDPFKICPMCSSSWCSRDDFLSDTLVELIGYQVHFADLKLGYFMFNHDVCGTTMALVADKFSDLYPGEPFTKRLTGSDKCPAFCLHDDELDPCLAECECAYVRDIIQIIRKWPKAS